MSIYRFIWKNSARQQLVVCLVALITLPLTLAPIELQRRIVDDAIGESDLRVLITLVTIYAAVIVIQQLIKFIYNFLSGKLSERLIRRLRVKILAVNTAEDGIGSSEEGAVVTMLTGEVEPIGGFGGSAYAQLITEGGVLLTIMSYMLFTQFQLAVVAICAFIPQAIATPMVQKHINTQSAERISLVRSVGDDALAAAQGDGSRTSDAKKHVRKIYSVRLIINKLKFGLKAVLNLFDHLADLVVLGFGGYLVIQGETNIGVVVAFLSGLSTLRSPWRALISYYRVVSDVALKFDMLREKVKGLD